MFYLLKLVKMYTSRINKIFHPKNKGEKSETTEASHKFHALTPIDDVKLGIYESALDFVFSNNDIKNVAVSGAYGAGKSSVIKSYDKKNSEKSFLYISLTRFQSETKEDEGQVEDEEEANKTVENAATESPPAINTVLEGKILNQRIHQIPAKNIPLTNFRVKQESKCLKNVITALLVVFGISLGILVLHFPRWQKFVCSLEVEKLSCVLGLFTATEIRFYALVMFMALLGFFIYRIVKMQGNHNFIKKSTLSGVEIEIFKDSKNSYFDKYLNEVLYLFKHVNEDVIVFEDIDRYDSSQIFERLHEISRLVNNEPRRKNKPLRFFYLLKDDIFVTKDRTKFFDFIMPIVPIMDGSNALDIFLGCFEKIGIEVADKGGDKLNTEFLQGISLYIDDMRLLQNICNEFSVYHSRISTTEQDENKMFALIAYKNLFPRDFAALQLDQGFMYEIIGPHGRGKERLIRSEISRIDD